MRGERLTSPPAIEILRGTLKADGSVDRKSFRQVLTVPGALVGGYRLDDRIQIVDAVAPEETRTHPGAALAYRVQTRADRKRASAESNTVVIRVYPVPERIGDLRAEVTESAVELNWSAPARTSGGETLAGSLQYRIYRGELDPASSEEASKNLPEAKWKSPLALLAESPTASYRDTTFEFGKTYTYIVRTAMATPGGVLESSDSVAVVVAPRDTFPPAVPHDVVAAVIGGEGKPVEVDLSWSINVESDMAGYRIYRSERAGDKGEAIHSELLLSPAYRDTSVQPGQSYWYSITAVDRSGNESEPSPPVAVEVAKPSS